MHADANCLLNAGRKLSGFRGMTMYSTLIPCNMCAGTFVHFDVIKVVYGEARRMLRPSLKQSRKSGRPT